MKLFRASLCLLFICGSASAATKTWTGAASSFWSVGGNWSGGVPPVNGDVLIFPDTPSNSFTLNDLSGISIAGMTIGNGSPNYVMSGQPITLTGDVTIGGGSSTWNLPTTLGASITFTGGFTNYTSTFTLGGNTLTFVPGTGTMPGSINGTGTLVIGQNGTLRLTGSINITGTVTLTDASMDVEGSVAATSLIVGPRATLTGNGTIPATTLTSPATLQPGHDTQPGGNDPHTTAVLTANGNFTAGSDTQMQFDLVSPTPGSGHDQLAVTGTVTLTPTPELELSTPSLLPTTGQSFVIVSNDGADPVSGIFKYDTTGTGTFINLPEGATFSVGFVVFQITYIGGSGNDVVLTVTSSPKTWTGAVNSFWSVAGNWNGGVAPVNGDFLVFPNGSSNSFTLNDISGISIAGMSVGGAPSYVMSGQPVTLTGNVTIVGSTWNLPVTLGASINFSGGFSSFTSTFTLGGNTLTFAPGTSTMSGSIGGTGNVILQNGSLHLTGSINVTGAVTVAGTSLNVLGSVSAASLTVNASGTLTGSGSVPATTLVVPANLRPGDSQTGPPSLAVLTVNGNFAAGNSTQLTFDITNITTPGSGYDQLAVNGTVTLTPSPQLLLTQPAIPPTTGQAFVIIANDGADPVSGTFKYDTTGSGTFITLTEGTTFTNGTVTFQISYVGGTGNDVVLTVTSAQKTWTGAVNSFWSIAGNWNAGVPPVSGDQLVFPTAATNKFALNDIAGLSIAGMTVGGGYVMSGLGITLTGDVDFESGTWNLPVTLGAAVTVDSGGGVTNYQSTFTLGGNTLTIVPGGNTTLSGSVGGTGNLIVGAPGHALSAVQHTGAINITGNVTVSDGALNVNGGTIAATLLTAGPRANLRGSGTIPATTLTSPATLQIGTGNGCCTDSHARAILTANGNFTAGSSTQMAFDLVNTTPGTGHDQLAVTGTVTLTPNPQLQITAALGLTTGSSFVIIANDGADAVSGTFMYFDTGLGTFVTLPEGATFVANGNVFRISYVGGTGNDVVLTVIAEKTWSGAVSNLWSVGGNWVGGVAPANGDRLIFPSGASNTNMNNDLAGLSVAGVTFSGGTYTLTGNALTLTGPVTQAGNVTWNVPTTLGASVIFDAQTATTLANTITLGGNTLTIIPQGIVTITGAIGGTGNVIIGGPTCCLTGVQLPGAINVVGNVSIDDSAVNVTGSIAATLLTIGPGARVSGTGSVPTTFLGDQSRIEIGDDAAVGGADPHTRGILTMNGNFSGSTGGNTLAFDLVNPTPGSGHDQLVVNGTIAFNNQTLGIAFPSGLPLAGQAFLIIVNDGSDPITGTFVDRPENSTFTFQGVVMRINYTGGTGNDVVLTVVSSPATAADIPTLNEWMLLLLGLALAIAAARMVR